MNESSKPRKPAASKGRKTRGGKRSPKATRNALKDPFAGVPRHVVKLDSLRNEWWHASKFQGEAEAYHLMLSALHTAWAVTESPKPEARELTQKWLKEARTGAAHFIRELAKVYWPGYDLDSCCIPPAEHRAGPFMLTPCGNEGRASAVERLVDAIGSLRERGSSWETVAAELVLKMASPLSPVWGDLSEQTRQASLTPEGFDSLIAKARKAVSRAVDRSDPRRGPDREAIIRRVATVLGVKRADNLSSFVDQRARRAKA